ncbi:efflux RND transporter periplasmic adaptor subunit [Marinicella sediminis]|uniref:Efflux RND transporter periplasmic adaptor subunit n=1 Tax=Marinicella sediminis TaxID=1792834 RepID=A0ABV7JC25_9GAMM|nr:efflux RND transporter periplasmic adaptor subunit [Marinicella sediminis]
MKARILLMTLLFNANWTSAQSEAVPVITSTANIENHASVVEALGTLRANESVTITSTVTELVTDIHFTDGQRVRQGDLLITMDTSDELALLAEEQARLAEAQRQVKRLQPLARQNTASKSALDTQQSLVSVSEARIEGINSQINKRRITAPFDGVVGLKNISVGALAQPGNELATLDDDTTMKMDFSVPEKHLSYLMAGLEITAQSQAFPGKMFNGTISSIDSRINPNTRAVQVRALIDNPEQLLKPGILMRIKLLTQQRESLLIPEGAVTSSGTNQSVFVINPTDSTAQQVSIKTGSRYDGKLEILSGLDAGDQVVIHGNLRIQNGSQVEVIAIKRGEETLSELLAQRQNKNQQET